MAIFVLTDAVIWVHDQDLTGTSNKVSLKTSVDDQDATVFGGGGYKARVGGLREVELSVEGYADTTATPDAAAFAALGAADRPYTVAPASPAGSVAYLFQAAEFTYEQLGAVGEVAPYKAEAKGTNKVGVARGQIAKAKAAVSSTGALGSSLNLGAGGAGKWLYATLHVFSAGTTITVVVQSDTTSGFAAPTTRATLGPITATGGTFLTRVDASAITDTWWRFNVSAITGSFTVGAALAIQ